MAETLFQIVKYRYPSIEESNPDI